LLDVLDAGCNKGAALARWAAGRGLDRAQVMAVGDNWNDKEMLEFAGLPVVMANSSEELKQEGWAVTRSNDESGVAAAIEKFLLTD
ncbi:MAG: HAD family hydrolase, partial [Candidatus Acidiferrales bacterium]